MDRRVAVVTGANKGIGFAIVKHLLERFDGPVYLTSRDDARGKAAVAKLNEQGFKPEYHQLDVTDRNSIAKLSDHLKSNHGGIDILINNAGVASVLKEGYEEAKYIVDINYYSYLLLEDLLYPVVRDGGRIVNVASDCGHLSNVRNKHWIERLVQRDITREDINQFVQWFLESRRKGTFNKDDIADGGSIPAYRVSKVALCALTWVQQRALAARGVAVNALHPGLVQTDMTRHVGFLSPAQAARTAVYLALDAPHELHGQYVWHDQTVLDWYDYKADYFFKIKTLLS